MIYFDNAATTKPLDEAIEIFNNYSKNEYYNASAGYTPAFEVAKKIEKNKEIFLQKIHAKGKLIFTSGATESNNLAILGSTFYKNKKYLFSIGEHPSVYNTAVELKNRGYDVEFISLQKNGQIDYNQFESLMTENVCFVSVMFVNNETGAINDLNKIREIIDSKNKECVFHVDAVQGLGKIKLNISKSKINLCSFSAHKINGIKGIGALFVSENTKIKNINYGGGQENNLRSGTVNSPAIMSFFYSIEKSLENIDKNLEIVANLKNYLITKLEKFKNVTIVSNQDCSPYIVSLIINNNRGETIMRFLSSKNILIGTGSACSTSKVGNRVLESMGYSKQNVIGAIRISFNAFNNTKEIDEFIASLKTLIM